MPTSNHPEKLTRAVVDACADCDVCRDLMDANCLMFSELYRLWDREMDRGAPISSGELRHLVDLCNFCALCPCPNIRSDLMSAKSAFIERDGLSSRVRVVEDVALVSRICGTFPRLTNALFRYPALMSCGNHMMGIHPDRRMPEFPMETFPAWAERHELHRKPEQSGHRKAAYFAGCTANYLFPDVAKATVSLLQDNGVDVWYPPQKCCGMPTFLEGDQRLTRKFIRSHIPALFEAVNEGFDIVCSCPTCGFFLKCMLKEGAYYSAEYQASVNADSSVLKVPDETTSEKSGELQFLRLQKSIYGKILLDDGDFAFLPPLQRIRVAEHTMDLGEYLQELYLSGELTLPEFTTSAHWVYFPPCHQREQKIGSPYLDLLNRISGVSIEPLTGTLYCCGMAGIMGFKSDFHEASLKIGQPLMEKIVSTGADRIVTDCLSCRLQFRQVTPLHVSHPIEIIAGWD